MKKILVPTLIAAAIASLSSVAHAAEPESSLAFNAGVVSDYRYRGISQSRLEPALQGGVDYTDKSGFYVGAWGSTIKWIRDAGVLTEKPTAKGSVELDLYGGYRGAVGDVAYDVGFLRYEYVGNTLADTDFYRNANTNEIYGAVTYGVFTAKYSHALSNLFGNPDSKNSYYVDLSATLDLGDGYSLVPHVGYQKIKGAANVDGSYTDYALTLAKDLGNGLSATAALVGTDASKTFYTTPNDKFPGRTGAVVGLKYSF
ncbi:MAG: TorF family putative porin [Limnohabitans sp.]